MRSPKSVVPIADCFAGQQLTVGEPGLEPQHIAPIVVEARRAAAEGMFVGREMNLQPRRAYLAGAALVAAGRGQVDGAGRAVVRGKAGGSAARGQQGFDAPEEKRKRHRGPNCCGDNSGRAHHSLLSRLQDRQQIYVHEFIAARDAVRQRRTDWPVTTLKRAAPVI
ncbi:hypothetical protein AXW67_39125 [Bradyrhizobium neotropicale]|uniref:Uncharacterized protein n=2 Tax=Bradyrhizobium neotropicale TaxID=1497615 RepID=A0A176ZER2_9BRAD|nr:hypothetical protein AXW67_39125 [Bradyrhizobium neotropicale]